LPLDREGGVKLAKGNGQYEEMLITPIVGHPTFSRICRSLNPLDGC
jgi:hypothetical protein